MIQHMKKVLEVNATGKYSLSIIYIYIYICVCVCVQCPVLIVTEELGTITLLTKMIVRNPISTGDFIYCGELLYTTAIMISITKVLQKNYTYAKHGWTLMFKYERFINF